MGGILSLLDGHISEFKKARACVPVCVRACVCVCERSHENCKVCKRTHEKLSIIINVKWIKEHISIEKAIKIAYNYWCKVCKKEDTSAKEDMKIVTNY